MINQLIEMHCDKIGPDTQKLPDAGIAALKPQIPDWEIKMRDDVPQLERVFKFANFAEALDFTVKIGRIAEEEDHHPSLLTEWGKVTVTWWTHKVNGLHRNDFIMAARTDQAYASHSQE